MFILLNMSKNLDGFNLYQNNFFPLMNEWTLGYIDYSKSYDENNINYDDIRFQIKNCLINSYTSKYSIIILYDFNMQKYNPLLYSITSILNNFDKYIIEKLRRDYILECVYFVCLDDVERDYDNEIIDENLKDHINFDKYGYLKDCEDDKYKKDDYNYFIKESDCINLKNDLKKIFKKYKKSEENYKIICDEFEKQYILPLKNRVIDSFNKIKNSNNDWYVTKFNKMLKEYNNDIEKFVVKICDGDKSIDDINFSLADYCKGYISSYYNLKHKIFRLNMLDNAGRFCRNEAQYRSYFKIISFVNFICKEDKKYIFGGNLNYNQNHYGIEIDIDDSKIDEMYNLYYNNLNNEANKLGDYKFSDVTVEEYEYHFCDTHIPNDKKYENKMPNFSLFKNRNDENNVNEYVDKWKDRYIDFVNYCNQRLRKITDKLRTEMHKTFNGKKSNVTINELNRIVEEKEMLRKELKDKIANNTPRDIILIDYKLYDEHEKYKKDAIEILDKRIDTTHFGFNILIIIFCSLITLFLFRRFNNGVISIIYKIVILLTPSLFYIIIQLIFSYIKVAKANLILGKVENYTKNKLSEIDKDDDKFVDYVNNVFELMMLTKYIDKLNMYKNDAAVEIDNYRNQKDNIDSAMKDFKSLVNLLRVKVEKHYNKICYKRIDINKKLIENDAFCPLLYLSSDYDNYILVNNQHTEKLKSNLLNLVNNIKFDYDEVVYDER